MNQYSYILFDLDGTVTDPGMGITNSVMYALDQFGIHVGERSELYPFIGPPLADSFMKYFGFSQGEAEKAIAYYREYYKEKGIFENLLYEGMEDMLARLTGMGKKLVLATSKPEVFARQILEHFQLDGYFYHISGATLDGSRVNKDEIITAALEECSIRSAEAVMVGDRMYDIEGARKNGIVSIGVLYGYGSREELEDAGADRIAETVEELGRIINSLPCAPGNDIMKQE